MLSKLKIVIAVAVLSGTVSANVQPASATAEDSNSPSIHNTSETTVTEVEEQNTDTNPPSATKVESHYMVKLGDTLWSIANAHQVTVVQLMLWNGLDTDIIQPDLKLVIYKDEKDPENTEVPETEDTIADLEPEPVKIVPEKPIKKDPPKSKPKPKVITVKATAYTAYCKGCSGITKTGINLRANPKKKVIAVDPRVIPLGTKVHVEGFGTAIAADIGKSIKGKRIDVFIPNKKRAIKFGVKNLKITIID